MMTPILVTGGTGTLGRLVVARLRTAGHPVRVVSRGDPRDEDGLRVVTGDLATGAGIAAAVAGVNTIVHCASSAKGDVESTRNLAHAASRTGDEPHLVYVSIVGADRLPYGYMRTKLECERLVAESGLPWTLLRATQFYDLILTGAKRAAKLPLVPVPAGLLCQPVDAADVADRLVELALGAPAGRVPDLAGPRQWEAAELIREYLRATGRRRPVVPVLLPGTGRVRAGALLATGQPTTGRRTWKQFLASRLS